MSSLDAPTPVRALPSEPEAADAALLGRHGATLLALARTRIAGFARGERLGPVDLSAYPPELAVPRACFVTLSRHGNLRGCVGSAKAWRPLLSDVAENAVAAASDDPRFPPLAASELADARLSISLLSPPVPVAAASEETLLAQLEPGKDGLILRAGVKSALFLPQVWHQLPSPREFLAQLKVKAGLAAAAPVQGIEWQRFRATSVSEPGAMD